MKILFLDCGMGAAGDMLTSALLELLPDRKDVIRKLNSLNIPGVHYSAEPSVKCGITGTHIHVTVNGIEEHEYQHTHEHTQSLGHGMVKDVDGYCLDSWHGHDVHEHIFQEHNEDARYHDGKHENTNHGHHGHGHDGHGHHHSSLTDIEQIVSAIDVPESVREDIIAVYHLIAEAESTVHGVPVTQIHFHEVGTMDAVADITAVSLLIHELAPDKIVASPVNTGSGQVRCAHGVLPVPAPATAYILKGIPCYQGNIQGELCTPTGAALLKHFANSFDNMPLMNISSIGYGMGTKDFDAANCVRAFMGESDNDKTETVLELSCNVDDMTAEDIGYATEKLFQAGAHEVYTVPIGMKKNRPGTLIRVMCKEENRDKFVRLIFKYTSTIGIRETITKRYVLSRNIVTEDTPLGPVRKKISTGYGITRSKYEYDDISRIADEKEIGINDVKRKLM